MFVNKFVFRMFARFSSIITDRRADEYGEKGVVIVFVVLLGIAAFQAFGGSVAGVINSAAGAI